MPPQSTLLKSVKMRILRSLSASVFVFIGTFVFGFIVMLCIAVQHMDRDDPRALMFGKVIGDGLLFLGMIVLVIRQEMTKLLMQRTENKLEVNTQATVETKQTMDETKESVAKIVEQTNGGLTKRMQQFFDENKGKFATKDELQTMVRDAAEIAVEKAARKKRRRR